MDIRPPYQRELRYDVSGIWTEQQQAILVYLNEHPNATREELCEKIPDATMGGIILGLLKRVGGRKQGYWECTQVAGPELTAGIAWTRRQFLVDTYESSLLSILELLYLVIIIFVEQQVTL